MHFWGLWLGVFSNLGNQKVRKNPQRWDTSSDFLILGRMIRRAGGSGTPSCTALWALIDYCLLSTCTLILLRTQAGQDVVGGVLMTSQFCHGSNHGFRESKISWAFSYWESASALWLKSCCVNEFHLQKCILLCIYMHTNLCLHWET